MPHPPKENEKQESEFLDVTDLMVLGGYLGLSPDKIYEMTPCEYNGLYRGYLLREQRQASYVRLLLSVHAGKKTPSIEEISGIRFKSEGEKKKTFESAEDKLNEIKEMQRLFGLEKERLNGTKR